MIMTNLKFVNPDKLRDLLAKLLLEPLQFFPWNSMEFTQDWWNFFKYFFVFK